MKKKDAAAPPAKSKKEPLIFERPLKPIGEMTEVELDAWADDFVDRIRLALAEKMGIDPSEVPLINPNNKPRQ